MPVVGPDFSRAKIRGCGEMHGVSRSQEEFGRRQPHPGCHTREHGLRNRCEVPDAGAHMLEECLRQTPALRRADFALSYVPMEDAMYFRHRPGRRLERVRLRYELPYRAGIMLVDVKLRDVRRVEIHRPLAILFQKSPAIAINLWKSVPELRHVRQAKFLLLLQRPKLRDGLAAALNNEPVPFTVAILIAKSFTRLSTVLNELMLMRF